MTIAIADAFSDALGIHMSEGSENMHTASEIWGATIATFISKFFFAVTFAIPILLFPLFTAVIASLVWGLFVLAVLSYIIACKQCVLPWKVVGEHLLIAFIVIGITHWVGDLIANWET